MPVIRQLPIPCPGHLIPDATDSFGAVYRAAKAQGVVFVAIERQGQQWTVKADALTTGPGRSVDDTVNQALRAAIVHLVHVRQAGADAYKGPIYFMLYDVPSEKRDRALAAAFQAALYGDTEPLRRAVPGAGLDT
jgi:hypothetical protein